MMNFLAKWLNNYTLYAKRCTLLWPVFLLVNLALLLFFLTYPPTNFGGDIAEYFGITESVINHGGLNLTQEDRKNLESLLKPEYFEDPGYYVEGGEGDRYPVHFFFYSILATPIRLLLKLLELPELHALRLTNLFVFILALHLIIERFLKNSWQKSVFLFLSYFSPLVWFIIWPGPDLYYLSLLLLAVFLFYEKNYALSAFLVVLASWQSQPLMILALGLIGFYLFFSSVSSKTVAVSLSLLGLMLVPYLYNLFAFGTLTPWTIFEDGWTQIYGFGLHNASFKKLFEQIFDLNFGLFWYAPVIVGVGFYSFLQRSALDRKTLIFLLLIIATAFFYQTNPAWHYGTSGYGPSRHAIFLLPFLIYFATAYLAHPAQHLRLRIMLFLFLFSQLLILSFNGWLAPNLLNTLRHSPYAKFALNNFPAYYNPTPEIFVDRTTNTDPKYPQSAVYKVNGVCKKAYLLKTDRKILEKECGYIEESAREKLDNEFLRKASYPRRLKTIEAVLWPDPTACEKERKPYVCLRSQDDVFYQTQVLQTARFEPIEGRVGTWRLLRGKPLELILPPGYTAQHYSWEGVYVNYP